MTRRLLLSYLSITAFVLLVLEVPLGISFADREREQLTTRIERDATVVGTVAEDTLQHGVEADLAPYVLAYQARTGGRVVIVDDRGISVADSDAPEDAPRDFSTRPEIAAALRGERASGTRSSETLGTDLLYVAVPVASGGNVWGAVRITYPTKELDDRIRRNWIALGLLAVVVLAAVAVVGFVLARSVTRPVRALEATAVAIAGGDLRARAPAEHGPPELRTLAERFNDMAARLEELLGAQQAFVADASHQLRTPLTALRLRLENLESAAPEQLRDDLTAAVDETSRLGRLVEGLLVVARAEGARPERGVVDVAAKARERASAWEPLAEERGVRLAVEAGTTVPAMAVVGALEQILDNLLANALEVAPAGSAVTVGVSRRDRWAELHVIDEGPGLPAADRVRAFDRFWRGAGSHDPHGSGLGLAIVRQLAVASGGEAELREAVGGGVDAVIRLPAARIEHVSGDAS